MGTKEMAVGTGNAAEKLKLTRAMPNLSLAAPLPAEGAPAVTVKPAVQTAGPARTYRISTYLSKEAGARLDRLVAHLKATEGRRRSAPDVLERALLAYARELGL